MLLQSFVRSFLIQVIDLSLTAGLQVTAFEKNGLCIRFLCERDPGVVCATVINMIATNSTPFPITDFVFQAAVPKVICQENARKHPNLLYHDSSPSPLLPVFS